MNCPNCGADNDAEARFCAECGTPLDNVVVETAKVEQVFNEADEEMTIISASGELAAEAKTLTVDQAEVVATEEDADKVEEVDDDGLEDVPEPSPPPSTPSPADSGGNDEDGGGMDLGGGDDDGSGNNRTLIIVGIVVLLVLLLCCCCSVLVGVAVGSDPNVIEDLMREITMQSVYSVLV